MNNYTIKKLAGIFFAAGILTSVAACSSTTASSTVTSTEPTTETVTTSESVLSTESAVTDSKTTYPIVIEHAFGSTTIEEKPERIATISWGNQDVPLALGLIPVGVSQANYGVKENELLLPWTQEAFSFLGEETPNIYSDTDGLDYEAISDSSPDVILAAYSGLTQEEYDLLSQIAPVIAYTTAAWQTPWREQILLNSAGIGLALEGEALVSELDTLIADKSAAYPQLEEKTAAFFYFNPSDLGSFYVYLPADPRASYLTDLGMSFPESLLALATDSSSFSLEMSAENVSELADVDVMVVYGNEDLLAAMQADPLLRTIPAVANGSVALIEDGSALAASGTPSALSIPATIDEYLSILGAAADLVK